MKTYMENSDSVERNWYIVDAKGQTLGRLATRVASLLKGKHKPSYTPHVDCGDYVIVVNAKEVELSGKKWDQKMYYSHSQHAGGLRERTARQMNETRPAHMVELAVRGMIPKGKLGRRMFKKLYVYETDEHPHQAQQPTPVELEG